jgi:hypothetical protein
LLVVLAVAGALVVLAIAANARNSSEQAGLVAFGELVPLEVIFQFVRRSSVLRFRPASGHFRSERSAEAFHVILGSGIAALDSVLQPGRMLAARADAKNVTEKT